MGLAAKTRGIDENAHPFALQKKYAWLGPVLQGRGISFQWFSDLAYVLKTNMTM